MSKMISVFNYLNKNNQLGKKFLVLAIFISLFLFSNCDRNEGVSSPSESAFISLTANPAVLPADGTSTSSIQAVVVDDTGQAVKDGTLVVFSTSLGSITASALTSIGIAKATLTASTSSGLANITAQAGSSLTSIQVPIGSAPPGSIILAAYPNSIPANGSSKSEIWATVKDQDGKLIADDTTVTFVTTLGTITASATTTDGLAKATLTAGKQAGSAVIVAQCLGLSNSIAVEFTGAESGSIDLSANPSIILANGLSASEILAIVKDANGSLVVDGTKVDFTASLGSITDSSLTDGGIARATLTSSTQTGTCVVTAISGIATGTVSVIFNAVAYTITLTAYPDEIPADGSSSSQLMTTVRDTYGNLVPDGLVVEFFFTEQPAGCSLSPSSLTTSDGTAWTTLYAGNTIGSACVVAVCQGVESNEECVELLLP